MQLTGEIYGIINLIEKLTIAKYKINFTLDVALVKVMAACYIPQGILYPRKAAVVESSLICPLVFQLPMLVSSVSVLGYKDQYCMCSVKSFAHGLYHI